MSSSLAVKGSKLSVASSTTSFPSNQPTSPFFAEVTSHSDMAAAMAPKSAFAFESASRSSFATRRCSYQYLRTPSLLALDGVRRFCGGASLP